MDAITISDGTSPKDPKESLDPYFSTDNSTKSDNDDVITISTDASSTQNKKKSKINGCPESKTYKLSTIEDKTSESSLRLWTEEQCETFKQHGGELNDETPNSELKVNDWINSLNFNDTESNSSSSKLNYFSLDREQSRNILEKVENGKVDSDSDNSKDSLNKIDKADIPLSPETQKKNELCLYLQLMDMSAADKKTVSAIQNRRSTRVRNLKIMSEKRNLDQKLLSEFKESLARKSFDELDMMVEDSFDLTSEKYNFFNVEFLPPKMLDSVKYFDESIMSALGSDIRKKIRTERKNGINRNNNKENKKLLVAKLQQKLSKEKEKKSETKTKTIVKATTPDLNLLKKQNMLRTTKNLRSTKALRSSLNLNNVGIKSLTMNERLIRQSLKKTKLQNLRKSKKNFSQKFKIIDKKSMRCLRRGTKPPLRNIKKNVTKAEDNTEEDTKQPKKEEIKKKSKVTKILNVKRRNQRRSLLDERRKSSLAESSEDPIKEELPVSKVEPQKIENLYEDYIPKKKRMSLLMSMAKKMKTPEKSPEKKDVKVEEASKKEEFNGALSSLKPEDKPNSKSEQPGIEKEKQAEARINLPEPSNATIEPTPKINSTITVSPMKTVTVPPSKPEFSIKYKTQSETCNYDEELTVTRAVDILNMIKCNSGSTEATIKEKIHFTNTADILYKSTSSIKTKNSPMSNMHLQQSSDSESPVSRAEMSKFVFRPEKKPSPQKTEGTFNVIDLSKSTYYNAWQEHNYTKNTDADKEYIMNVILGTVSEESSSSSEEDEEDEEEEEIQRPETPKTEDYKEIPKPNVELPKEIFEEVPKTPPRIEKTPVTPKQKRTLHRLLVQKNRSSFDSLDFGNDSWTSEQSHANTIKVCPSKGKTLKAIYLGFNLVIVQEQLVSFWTQSPLGNMLGVQNLWVAKGSVQRLVLDSNYICKESQDVVVNLDKSCAYIELWMKEHKSDKRERPVADIFATVYFWSAVNSTQSSKKVLQLENIKGDINDVQYVVVRTARKIVVSWLEAQDSVRKTIIHCYTLAPDYQTVIDVLTMNPLDHYVQSLHTIGECADAVVGFGEKYITVWGLEYGEIFETIEIDPKYRDPRIMWLEKDRGLLFFIQYHRIEKLLMLVAVNGYSKESKKMQVFRVPSDYETINGICVDNNMLAAIFENGVLCWDIKTGHAVIEELSTGDHLIASNRHIIALKSNIVEVVHFQSYFLTNFDLQT